MATRSSVNSSPAAKSRTIGHHLSGRLDGRPGDKGKAAEQEGLQMDGIAE